MGCGKGEIEEERLFLVTSVVTFKPVDGPGGDRGRRVVAFAEVRYGEGLVVEPVVSRGEMPVLVLDQVRVLEAPLEDFPIDVPLARVVRPVAGRSQKLR